MTFGYRTVQVIWFWVERSTLGLTAIQRGFELSECLLIYLVHNYILEQLFAVDNDAYWHIVCAGVAAVNGLSATEAVIISNASVTSGGL